MADAHRIWCYSVHHLYTPAEDSQHSECGSPYVKMPVAGVLLLLLLMAKYSAKQNGEIARLPKGEWSRARYAKDVGQVWPFCRVGAIKQNAWHCFREMRDVLFVILNGRCVYLLGEEMKVRGTFWDRCRRRSLVEFFRSTGLDI